MAFDYQILWTAEAINNLESILEYLTKRWSQHELNNFKVRLSNLVNLIRQNPILFPVSQYNFRLRKAVLSKQITIFYEVAGQIIYVVYLFNNRQNIERIK